MKSISKKTKIKFKSNYKKVKLNHIFECDGRLYSIAIPTTASSDTNLEGGRNIYQFYVMD